MGGDSLAAAKLVSLVNREFGVDVPIQTLFDHDALKQLSSCIEIEDISYVSKLKSKTPSLINWVDEIKLDPLSLPSPPKKPEKMKALLTGANGFLGIYLLKELIERSKYSQIVCIVSAKSDEEAGKRMKESAKKYRLIDELDFTRIEIVHYDSRSFYFFQIKLFLITQLY